MILDPNLTRNCHVVALEGRPRKLVHYLKADDTDPFWEWFRKLRSDRGRIQSRLDRIEESGNFGDHKHIDGGVWELRWLGHGLGTESNFGIDAEEDCVVLLCGGDKDSQLTDIKIAKKYWEDWNNAEENEGT